MFRIPEDFPVYKKEEQKIAQFKESLGDNSITQGRSLHFVEVDCCRFGNANEIIFTNGLNACTGMTIQTDKMTFAAHFSHEVDIKKIAHEIKRINSEQEILSSSIKICLGPWPKDSNSLISALKVLQELNLLETFIEHLQNHIRDMQTRKILVTDDIEKSERDFKIEKVPSMFWSSVKGELTIQEFLKLDNKDYEFDVYRLADFIDRIKANFEGEKNCMLQRIKHPEFVSTLDAIKINPTAQNQLGNPKR